MNDDKATWKKVSETDGDFCVFLTEDVIGFNTIEEVFSYLLDTARKPNSQDNIDFVVYEKEPAEYYEPDIYEILKGHISTFTWKVYIHLARKDGKFAIMDLR